MPVLVGGGCASKICTLVKEEDNTPLCRKNTRAAVRLVATETPEHGQESIRAYPTQKVAQLRCIYTACSVDSKQEELEIIGQLENYDTVAIMETM